MTLTRKGARREDNLGFYCFHKANLREHRINKFCPRLLEGDELGVGACDVKTGGVRAVDDASEMYVRSGKESDTVPTPERPCLTGLYVMENSPR